MEKLYFEDGYKEYEINGDKNRVLRFNPNDIGIIDKMKKCERRIGELKEKFKDRKDENIVAESKQEIKSMVDDIFYDGAFEIIFSDTHPLSLVNVKGKEKPVLITFFEAITKEVEKEVGKTKENQEKLKEEYRENVRAITSKRNHK